MSHMVCVSKTDLIEKILRNVKTNLLSRDVKRQIKALDFLSSKMESKVAAEMINSDLPELLCDILSNHKPRIIKKIVECLLKMTKYKAFYEQRHSAAVVESTCRTTNMLTQDSGNLEVIYSGIKLITTVLSRSHLEAGGSLVDQLLHLVKKCLTNNQFQNIHLHVIQLILVLSKRTNICHSILPSITNHSLEKLILLLKNNKKKLKNHILVATEVMRLSLSCSSTYEGTIIDKIHVNLWKLIPVFNVKIIKAGMSGKVDVKNMMINLTFIIEAYKYFDPESSTKLTKLLISEHFLTLLPLVGENLRSKPAHNVSMLLLSELMKKLLTDHTMELNENEEKLIVKGYHYLPPKVSVWLKALDNEQHHMIHLSVIVYLYFLFLSCNSLNKMPNFLPHMCRFVKFQSTRPSPGIMKAIALLLAASSLSNEGIRQVVTANSKLVSWVHSVPLNLIYTHHPALLLWAFGMLTISRKIRINFLTLWLQQNDPISRKTIESLALKNSEVAFCLLDVVKTCPEEMALCAMDVLKIVSSREKALNNNQLSSRVWLGLRETLSLLPVTGSIPKERNVACMVHLACGLVPSRPDTLLLMRVTYQLLKFFHGPISNQTLHVQLLKLADILVLKMAQMDDLRAVQLLCDDQAFLNSLVNSLQDDSDCDPTTLPAIRLLSHLHWLQNTNSVKVKTTVMLSGEILLQLMATRRSVNLIATMHLSNVMLMSSRVKPLICLSTSTEDRLVETLYVDFQNLTVRFEDEVRNMSWRFQASLLGYCKVWNKNMYCHLLTKPYTSMAVQLALKKNGVNNQNVMEFLAEWLSGLQLHDKLPETNPRALKLYRLNVTVNDITTSLVNNTLSHDMSKLQINVASKILSFETKIQPSVIKSLEDRMEVMKKNAILQ